MKTVITTQMKNGSLNSSLIPPSFVRSEFGGEPIPKQMKNYTSEPVKINKQTEELL